MKDRTAQDLLAERRANVLESMKEKDKLAKQLLLAHVAQIDAELQRRRDAKLASAKNTSCEVLPSSPKKTILPGTLFWTPPPKDQS